jgi:hypothetical protein
MTKIKKFESYENDIHEQAISNFRMNYNKLSRDEKGIALLELQEFATKNNLTLKDLYDKKTLEELLNSRIQKSSEFKSGYNFSENLFSIQNMKNKINNILKWIGFGAYWTAAIMMAYSLIVADGGTFYLSGIIGMIGIALNPGKDTYNIFGA